MTRVSRRRLPLRRRHKRLYPVLMRRREGQNVWGDHRVGVLEMIGGVVGGLVIPIAASPVAGASTTTSSTCSVENNFADANGTATTYVFKDDAHFPDVNKPWNPGTTAFTPTSAAPIKHDMILAAEFQAPVDGSAIDRSTITFTGPTNKSGPTGTVTSIPVATGVGTNKTPHNFQGIGYMLYGISAGKLTPYNVSSPPNHGVIAYQLPGDGKLKDKDAGGNVIAYTLAMHVTDSDNGTADPPNQCGNASWTFAGTGDGKGLPTGECIEDSFFGNGIYPSNG